MNALLRAYMEEHKKAVGARKDSDKKDLQDFVNLEGLFNSSFIPHNSSMLLR